MRCWMRWEWTMGLPSGMRWILRGSGIPQLDGAVLGRTLIEAWNAIGEINARREALGLPMLRADCGSWRAKS